MRFIMFLAILAMAACVTPDESASSQSECSYSNLAEIVAEPERADGKTLCTELYSYSKHGFLAYYDKPVHDNATGLEREALLIGEEDASVNFLGSYPKDGHRVYVRGVIKLQLSCFKRKNSCVPVSKPIYIVSPNFTKLDQ